MTNYTIKEMFAIVVTCIITPILCIIIVWSFCAFGQIYGVWSSKKDGEASLAHAFSHRQIKIYEAKAIEESAKHLANAEIERAKGVAEANKIIGASLHNNESYLRYLWITSLENKQKEIIYVPTEANLPILEANRLKKE